MPRSLIILVLLLAACANPVAPTGGEKDTRAPKLVFSQPDTFAVNVRTNTFYLRFDEWIELKNIQSELLISPPQEQAPITRIRGKGVEIVFRDSLQPNTTYLLQFGKGIVDYTEGNPAAGFQYVFSTGAALDSGEISVLVTDAETGLPAEGVKILLHTNPDDSAVRKLRPAYAGFTSSGGEARLQYLKPGTYRIYALQEVGGDYLYNAPGEAIAFLSETVSPSQQLHLLRLFREAPEKNKHSSVRNIYPGKAYIRFIAPAPDADIRFNPEPSFFEWPSEKKDSLVLWFGTNPPDSMQIYLNWSHGTDTVLFRPSAWRAPENGNRNRGGGGRGPASSGTGQPETPFSLKRIPVKAALKPGQHPEIEFDHPILSADSARIFVNGKAVLPEISGTARRMLRFPLPDDKAETCTIVFRDSAFTDIFGNFSGKDSVVIKILNPDDAQEVILDIIGTDSVNLQRPVLRVFNENDKLEFTSFEAISNDSTGNGIRFQFNLFPGKYQLILWDDINGNGRWDTGKFSERIQPEPLLRQAEELEIRAGFSVHKTWMLIETAPEEGGRGSGRNSGGRNSR